MAAGGWRAYRSGDLEDLGAIEAYERLKAAYPHKVNLNALWALQAALLDIHWREISPEMKEGLKAELGD